MPQKKIEVLLPEPGDERTLGRQKCLASLPLTHYKAVAHPSCPPPTPPVMSTHLQTPPDRENLVHPCFPLDDEPQALQARLTSQDSAWHTADAHLVTDGWMNDVHFLEKPELWI